MKLRCLLNRFCTLIAFFPVYLEIISEFFFSVFLEKIEDCLEDHELLGPTFKEHVRLFFVPVFIGFLFVSMLWLLIFEGET